MERRRRAHRQRRSRRPHGGLQRGDIAGAEEMRVHSLVAKRLGDRIAKPHLPGDGVRVLWRFGAGGEHRDVARAVSQCTQPDIDPGRRHVLQLDGDNPGRQTFAATAEAKDQLAARRIVKQEAGVASARSAIRREQRPDLCAEVGHRRIRVGHRARRADGSAAAAAHAQVRLHLDVIAVGRDRAGRADVDALVAAGLVRAAVSADARFVGKVLRLLELANGLGELGDGGRLR